MQVRLCDVTGKRVHRLAIVDDHPVILEGLTRIFARCADISVIGALCDGKQAVQFALNEQPDVMIVDVGMPRMDGIEVVRQIHAICPEVRLLVLTGLCEPSVEQRAHQAGATCCMVKSSPKRVLIETVRELCTVTAERARRLTPASTAMPLSKREIEVIRLTCAGLSNSEIATHMGVAVSTVQTYRKRLRIKVGVSNARALAAWAVRSGLDGVVDGQTGREL